MTADVELPPLPASSYQLNHDDATGTEIAPPTPLWNADKMQAYARANVAHATAAKYAEIERLRAEVGERDASLEWWGRFASGAVNARNDAEARAERLAEALRSIAASAEEATTGGGHAECASIARAALDQEEGK